MTIIEYWLLGIALAMDCFTVSIAAGISARKLILAPMIWMSIAFGLFQGGMTMIGFVGASMLSNYIERFDHWIAFALLTYLGGRMIWEGCHDEESRSMNLLDYKVIPAMAVATSIDALAVGVSFGCLGNLTMQSVLLPVGIIALCSFLFTMAGLALGINLGKKINWPIEIVGGIILILIGIKIIVEHTL